MRKRLTKLMAVILVLCMTVALVPMAALAEEAPITPGTVRWVTEEETVECFSEYWGEGDEQVSQGERSSYPLIAYPGFLFWDAGSGFDIGDIGIGKDDIIESCDLIFNVFRDNEGTWEKCLNLGEGLSSNLFFPVSHCAVAFSLNAESGTYYCTVKMSVQLRSGKKIETKEIKSYEWTYEKPDTSLAAPTGLEIREARDGNWMAVCDYDENAVGYVLEWYFYRADDTSPTHCGNTTMYYNFNMLDPSTGTDEVIQIERTEDGKAILGYLSPYTIEMVGEAKYFFRAYALSGDITQVSNSEWSDDSPMLDTKPISEKVNDSLDGITSGVQDEESAKQAVEKLKETEDFTKTELLTALYTDETEDGVCSKIKKIEDNLTSVGAEVKADGDIGLDGDVTILGAKLNAAADANNSDKKVTLNVSKPEVDVDVSQDYINVVQISFDLDHVDYEADDELAVPVMVTMPVPEGIEPFALVILHYHKDGRPPERVSTMRVFKNDKWYVSFSVTSFSPFVFANELTAEVKPESLELDVGEKKELNLFFKESANIPDYIGFHWKSENETVASVTSTQGGITADVTGLTAGSTTISVYGVLSNGAEVVIADSVTVKVTKGVTPGPGTDPDPGTGQDPASKPSEPSSSDITVINPANGSVTASSDSAEPGALVTLTVTPDAGYELKTLTVTGKDGKTVTLTSIGNGKYTFTMPASEVEIQAVFAKIPVALPFTDVKSGDWFKEDVEYVYENGFMNGKTSTIFGPDGDTTRAEAVTVLWRMAGEPRSDRALAYTDTAEDAWYSQAVRWATAAGVVDGYGDGRFGPNDLVTREQLAAMLYRLASWQYGEAPQAGDALTFDDASKVSSWALVPMRWAVRNSIIIGTQGNLLDPQGTAVRAQLAAISSRYARTIG